METVVPKENLPKVKYKGEIRTIINTQESMVAGKYYMNYVLDNGQVVNSEEVEEL